MDRYICVHCHFYQPPRENPWLETIEIQDSAYPYHDWNERITAECYARNTASRIQDPDGKITKIVNNLDRISFNFGPTLLSWMKDKAPEVYEAILEAERRSRENFSGHSSALAQVYHHVIAPLANSRDKRTQIIWGIRDYEHRFGHRPEGMWLPETAVDLETLEILASLGIRFTILAPHQARRVRKSGARLWKDVSGARIDPSMAYECRLPSGRSINLFFYDGPISRAVAFEGLLSNGENFAHRLTSAFSDSRIWPQLGHIATDGETYGHHHRYGEMALAYALEYIGSNQLAQITNYGEFLEKHPPTHQVEIIENTAWSCAHGVERWRSDCGCNSGGHAWSQQWRGPLRAALDWLRDCVAPLYAKEAAVFLKDPWMARDFYVDVVLDRRPENIACFLRAHGTRAVDSVETVRLLKLLELQRHAMMMYTSCGWFFDELSGIETVQVIQYAGRVVQLAAELFGEDVEAEFLRRLKEARSNLPEHGDGAAIYEKWVKPMTVDLPKVAAHFAISSLFEPYADTSRIYCYTVEREDYHSMEAGRTRLAVGRARIRSEVTGESDVLSFQVLHLGDHNLTSGVRNFREREAYERLVERVSDAFSRAELPEVIRVLDSEFGAGVYSLKSLFRDDQQRIVKEVLKSTLAEAEAVLRQIYEHNATLMRFLSGLRTPMPRVFGLTAEFVLNNNLRRALGNGNVDRKRVATLLAEAQMHRISLDTAGIGYEFQQSLEMLALAFRQNPAETALLERLDSLVDLARQSPFKVSFWRTQNIYWTMLQDAAPRFRQSDDEEAIEWIRRFTALGEKLQVKV